MDRLLTEQEIIGVHKIPWKYATDIEANLCVTQDTKTRHATLEEVKGLVIKTINNQPLFWLNGWEGIKNMDAREFIVCVDTLDELLKAIEGLE